MPSWILFVLVAIMISAFRNAGRGKKSRYPNRNRTPQRPNPRVDRNSPPVSSWGTEGSRGSEGQWGTEGSGGSEGQRGTEGSRGSEGQWGTEGSRGSEGQWGTEGSRGSEGQWGSEGVEATKGQSGTAGSTGYRRPGPVYPTLEEPHETVKSSLLEPHETVKESNVVNTAPAYQNDKRSVPTPDTERVFAGESSYDRFGTDPVGRVTNRKFDLALKKEDLVRAVLMTEILSPPRARNPRRLPGVPKHK